MASEPSPRHDRPRRLEARHHAVDLVTALVLAAFLGLLTLQDVVLGTSAPTAVLPVILASLATAWRRSRPVLSVVLVYAITLARVLLGGPPLLLADVLVLIAASSIALYGPRWAYRTALAAGLVGCATVTARISTTACVIASLILIATWSWALLRRSRRDALATLRDRADRLETERVQQARLAAAAERARIAREMHDIVSHSLSVIIAQADGGRYAVATQPEAAGKALETIAETGRAALADMRGLLGVLRQEDATGAAAPPGEIRAGAADDVSPRAALGDSAGAPPHPAARGPQPAAQDVASLVDQLRDSGIRASFVHMGSPRTLPPGVGLTLYRVCQESLTNVLKHAGPHPSVTVLLTWGQQEVTLEVSDDGRGAAAGSDGLGQGVLGMRERAAMFGGTLTAGPRTGGGFRVRLSLPLPARSRPEDP